MTRDRDGDPGRMYQPWRDAVAGTQLFVCRLKLSLENKVEIMRRRN
jgi:hypothetical protein